VGRKVICKKVTGCKLLSYCGGGKGSQTQPQPRRELQKKRLEKAKRDERRNRKQGNLHIVGGENFNFRTGGKEGGVRRTKPLVEEPQISRWGSDEQRGKKDEATAQEKHAGGA